MGKLPRTWMEISSAALRHNLRSVQKLVGSTVGVMPIIKANAYGHGLTQVLQSLPSKDVIAVGVAYGAEALLLRKLGFHGRIVVLSSWLAEELPELLRLRIEIVVWDFPSLHQVQKVASKKLRPKIHLKLDTGTTRIGFLSSDIRRLKNSQGLKKLQTVGIFSHFANSEEVSSYRTQNQLKYFTTLVKQLDLQNKGITYHIACTAALLRYPEARFGLVRLGIGLYGLWPSSAVQRWVKAHYPDFGLQPALSWKTRLAQVKKVPAGTSIGYGATHRVKKATWVGVLPIGYADGFDRRLSNRGWVMIHGQPAPILGRVCMNLTMVQLNPKHKKAGAVATLIGQGVSLDDWAHLTDTIHYELVSRFNPTIERYVV